MAILGHTWALVNGDEPWVHPPTPLKTMNCHVAGLSTYRLLSWKTMLDLKYPCFNFRQFKLKVRPGPVESLKLKVWNGASIPTTCSERCGGPTVQMQWLQELSLQAQSTWANSRESLPGIISSYHHHLSSVSRRKGPKLFCPLPKPQSLSNTLEQVLIRHVLNP